MTGSNFFTALERQYALQKDGLRSFREKGWKQFALLGLPSRSHESFRYFPLRDFYATEPSLPTCQPTPLSLDADLVFVDGKYRPDLSNLPPQVIALPLEEALRSHGSFLQMHFSRTLQEEKDPFALLNLALHAPGLFLYVPPKTRIEAPIRCLYLTTTPAFLPSRLLIALGAGAKMTCLTTHHGIGSTALPVTEISLDEGAELDLLTGIFPTSASWHLEATRATLKKKAQLRSLALTTGSKAVRQSYRIVLKGEESLADLKGLSLLSGGDTAHTHVQIEHEAPHTRSTQLFKGVVQDHSVSNFEGKIYVHAAAQKTEAYQLSKSLILSPNGIAYSKPGLEIFADDVKASHGATISQLDKEALFYLQTRGIDPSQAARLLIGGFCRELYADISHPALTLPMEKKLRELT